MMRSRHIILCLALCCVILGLAVTAPAQQVTVGTPFHTANDSFFEQTGMNWGFNWRGMNASFGGPNMGAPQFGGFDPSAGIQGGWGFRGNGFNGFLNFSSGHGNRRSLVSQTPSVTMMNGQPGFISDTSQSPFVISFVPVVGGFPTVGTLTPAMPRAHSVGNHRLEEIRRRMVNREIIDTGAARDGGLPEPPKFDGRPRPRIKAPKALPIEQLEDHRLAAAAPEPTAQPTNSAGRLAAAQSSSAGRAVPSVAEARRLHEMEQASGNTEALVFFERARAAEESGKANVAKIYYNMAAKRAGGQLKEQIEARLQALESPGN